MDAGPATRLFVGSYFAFSPPLLEICSAATNRVSIIVSRECLEVGKACLLTMRSSVFISAALGAIGSAVAQSSSATPTSSASPSGTSSAPAQTHTVDVAKGGTFMYSPAVVNASAGDYISMS